MRIRDAGGRFGLARNGLARCVVFFAMALACAGSLAAQSASVEVLHSFSGPPNGVRPEAPLVQGSDGNFYGTTNGGGTYGTVFKITPSGGLSTLYAFTGGADGAYPNGLTRGSDGNLYGTTSYGGDTSGGSSGYGTVFKITPAGALTALYAFAGGEDGEHPASALTQGNDGNFYGTTAGGYGSSGYGGGTVFEITPAGVLTTLHSFTGGLDGIDPVAGLTLGADGNFYGTTFGYEEFGAADNGSVFEITPAGTLTTLYTFTGGADGAFPSAGLTLGSDGNFYGTTIGTVFRVTPTGVLTTLYAFTGGADDEYPSGGLTKGNDGNFYGTTGGGGSSGDGTVFRITPAGVLSTLYSFTGGAGGANPQARLTLGSDGNFYGTTYCAGVGYVGYGTVFKITPAGVLTTLYTFNGADGGTNPEAGLTLGSDGNFYGTTEEGGSSRDGTVFRITPAGVLSALYSYTGGADGAYPLAGLTLGSDGDFYGATEEGGSSGLGTVFKITPAGVLTTLYTFDGGAGGANPNGLTLGSDGNFYGTTTVGGSYNAGTVFKITPAGALTALHAFTGGADGDQPEAGLTLGSDGNFYGTTGGNGDLGGDSGTVFKITPAGVLTTLYRFTAFADGAEPRAALTQGSDGNFYGTTNAGGDSNGDGGLGYGTAFKITRAGVLTTLYTFTGGADGANPNGLTLGSDGNFYGTTYGGASDGDGTVFKITPAGVLTSVHTFTGGAGGSNPESSLTQGSDGNFYGTTKAGGQYGLGVVFRLLLAAKPEITSATASAQLGSAFSYQIAGASGPTSFGASNLPPGLSVNGATGLISGTPTKTGTFTVGLSATNSGGTGAGTLTLTVNPAAPVITSALTASGQAGQAFTCQITASNTPTSFGASGLPAGLSVDASTGVISGTPTVSGTFSVGLSAANAGGTGTSVLTLTLAPALPGVTLSPLPVVTLTARAPQVVIGSGHVGKFALTLPAPQSVDIVVTFAIKGSAIDGVDYQLIKASEKIKAGETRKIIKIVPLGDLEGASEKVVNFVLKPGDGYTVGTTSKVKVKIFAAGQ